MRRQLVPAIISILLFTVVLGLVYPLVVTGVAQVAFKDKADGSIVSVNGRQVGSSHAAAASATTTAAAAAPAVASPRAGAHRRPPRL